MLRTELNESIKILLDNITLIPDEFWHTAENEEDVIWILNRDDGTAGSYETSEERLGITRTGKILYGFSSGCSCWSGWQKDDYKDTITYKEFELMPIGEFNSDNEYEIKDKFDLSFAEGWNEEAYNNLKDYMLLIKKKVLPLEVFKSRNSEVRRYLMKKVGFDNVKKHFKFFTIHQDNDEVLFDIVLEGDVKERYIKVKDASSDKDYLLSVPSGALTCKGAVAWSFGLEEENYNPIIET